MRTGVLCHVGKWGRRILKRTLFRGARGKRVVDSRELAALSARVNELESLTRTLAEKCADLDLSVAISEWSVDALWEAVRGSRRTTAATHEGTHTTTEGEAPSPDLPKKETLN
ncbi:hypothetical protein [Frigoriglobus tundricola]|uniref:Uncharacterized protein n=1 Tax=Frigoriglobus tundricola TaxID=2774151 RepID=A0A6M5YGV8_9BACT|nr:hypothetical protein [Frigoriglobus tundricola]QJW93228.1 hypothetical protein FTUN_0733 [Frigoriglobus tundricola]